MREARAHVGCIALLGRIRFGCCMSQPHIGGRALGVLSSCGGSRLAHRLPEPANQRLALEIEQGILDLARTDRASSLDDRALLVGRRSPPEPPREEATEHLRDRLLLPSLFPA